MLNDTELLYLPYVMDTVNFHQNVECPDGENRLRIIMDGKLPEHTSLDETGNIVNDARLQISDLHIDDIELGQIFYQNSVYSHNFNGSRDPVEEKFFGEMGCNGEVTMAFTQPFYLWLLEHI